MISSPGDPGPREAANTFIIWNSVAREPNPSPKNMSNFGLYIDLNREFGVKPMTKYPAEPLISNESFPLPIVPRLSSNFTTFDSPQRARTLTIS